jgi:hypothetical protein
MNRKIKKNKRKMDTHLMGVAQPQNRKMDTHLMSKKQKNGHPLNKCCPTSKH